MSLPGPACTLGPATAARRAGDGPGRIQEIWSGEEATVPPSVGSREASRGDQASSLAGQGERGAFWLQPLSSELQ